MQIPRIMLAAPSSGSGKTITACGLMKALQDKGRTVVSCKCGPDYIDPMFHREVLGIDAENLDLFFCGEAGVRNLFYEHARDADIAVIEGVMGYYDGMGLDTDKASSYEVAKVLRAPVILVVSCKGAALSVLAVLKGMIEFRGDSNVQGILLNYVSEMMYPKMKAMVEQELHAMGHDIPVVGHIPKSDVFGLESRHLGLVTPKEIGDLQEQIKNAGALISRTIDLERIEQIAAQAPKIAGVVGAVSPVDSVRIAVAQDEAFCFYYKSNLELLKRLGCTLVPFSPLRDKKLPPEIQGILIGGGYPELYARELSENKEMCPAIRAAIAADLPCLAECGGFMYLHDTMEGADGIRYEVAAAIAGEAYRTNHLVRFGYITLRSKQESVYLKADESVRGHEFHYWDSSANGSDCIAEKPDKKRSWECVHIRGNLFAGYPHIHFGSNPVFAERFVRTCAKYAGISASE